MQVFFQVGVCVKLNSAYREWENIQSDLQFGYFKESMLKEMKGEKETFEMSPRVKCYIYGQISGAGTSSWI